MEQFCGTGCSAALLAAQRQLEILRDQVKASSEPVLPAHAPSPTTKAERPLPRLLPAHLGWESSAITETLRSGQERAAARSRREQARSLAWLQDLAQQNRAAYAARSVLAAAPEERPATIKLYPDLALAFLRHDQSSVARIWLLLRHIDAASQGWVSLDAARQFLTRDGSPLRVCGWRQLRKLLARGESLFWTRSRSRIWLRSIANVAASLDVFRLTRSPVSLPVSTLLSSIGTLRAHFYASFHSGRVRGTADARVNPIARRTLQKLCHKSRRTLRLYERRSGVNKTANFAVGLRKTAEEFQERAWRQGNAIFTFTDHCGKQGKKGSVYVAWQLPNSYSGPHDKKPKGSQKRINRELADLFMKGMTGNGKRLTVNSCFAPRRFFDNGFIAAAAVEDTREALYWRSNNRLSNGCQVWHTLTPARIYRA